EPRAGAVVSTAGALDNASLNHSVTWSEGLLGAESGELLRAFFQQRRVGQHGDHDGSEYG
ncbi:MAG: tRNA-specific adenosine deaminase, partial [Proteobacteria bacterium]|nr:tRNA-specific adenosine deaminase [Pseudomonadota bacterium]